MATVKNIGYKLHKSIGSTYFPLGGTDTWSVGALIHSIDRNRELLPSYRSELTKAGYFYRDIFISVQIYMIHGTYIIF